MATTLNKEITFYNISKFTLPTILSMLCMTFYVMVDGLFVSNYVNTTALSAINIVYPLINVFFAAGIMFATGSNAILGKQLGENKDSIARKFFSSIFYIAIIFSLVLTSISILCIKPILSFLGAEGELYSYGYDYLLIMLCFMPVAILQFLFQYIFVVAARPTLGLILTMAAGTANIIFDYLFIVVYDFGISGAALATGIGYAIPAISGIIFFSFFHKQSLYFVKPRFSFILSYRTLVNGSSEMVTNLSHAFTNFLFNVMTLKYIGVDGVAAITIILYAEYLLLGVFFGFSSGISPLFSYNYGARNFVNLKKLFRYSMIIVIVSSLVIFCVAHFYGSYITKAFTDTSSSVYPIAQEGLSIISYAFLLMGMNIFISTLFTALSNGQVSAILSFIRTFILLSSSIVLLPLIFGIQGIWLAIPFAEAIALMVSLFFLFKKSRVYNYY